MTNNIQENDGSLMRNVIVIGLFAGIGYWLWKTRIITKKIDEFRQKTTTQEMNKLYDVLGKTFMKKIFHKDSVTDSGAYSYGDEQLADSFKAGEQDYNIFFYPYYTWNSEKTPLFQLERVFRVKVAKPDATSGETIFIGTWKLLKDDKLKMSFYPFKQGVTNWKDVADKSNLKSAKTYTGTITDILAKATGGAVALDSLKK